MHLWWNDILYRYVYTSVYLQGPSIERLYLGYLQVFLQIHISVEGPFHLIAKLDINSLVLF